jgi:menaquinone-9 beta-reductase
MMPDGAVHAGSVSDHAWADSADVVIVGGGPAGSVTALLLARAGADVLIVDRARFPRGKACGECLSPRATTILEELGLLEAVLGRAHATLAGWHIHAPGGARLEGRFADVAPALGRAPTPPALAIDRALLDSVLLDAAIAAGARLFEPARIGGVLRRNGAVTGVTGRTTAGEPVRIHAGFVVGADGLRSAVARAVGAPRRRARRKKYSLTAHIHVAQTGRFGELRLAPDACVGIAPVSALPDGLCNVTVVLAGQAAAASRGSPADRLAAALGRFPAVLERCRPALAAAAPKLHASGPFDLPMRSIAGPGFALAGDAAGYYDPFTGQGICHALMAARRLADALTASGAGARPQPAALRRYAAAEARHRTDAHRLQRAIDFVISRPALADRLIPLLQRSPRMAAALFAATGDLIPPRALLSPGLLLTFRSYRTG